MPPTVWSFRPAAKLVILLAVSIPFAIENLLRSAEAQASCQVPELHVIGLMNAGSPLFSVMDNPPPEFASWQRFWDKVRTEGSAAGSSPGKRIWLRLPDKVKRYVEDGRFMEDMDRPRPHRGFFRIFREDRVTGESLLKELAKAERNETLDALNQVLKDRQFYEPEAFKTVCLPPMAVEMRDRLQSLSYLEIQCFNRLLLDATYSDSIYPMPGISLPAGQAEVQVYRREKPIVLMLIGRNPIRWHVKCAEGVRLEKVILAGYFHQEVTGVDVLVENHAFFKKDQGPHPDMGFFHPPLASPMDLEARKRIERQVEQLSGIAPATIQGRQNYDETPFMVGVPPERAVPIKTQILALGLSRSGAPDLYHDFPFPDYPAFVESLRQQIAATGPSLGKRLFLKMDEDSRRLLADETYLDSVKKAAEKVRAIRLTGIHRSACVSVHETQAWLPRLQHILNDPDLYRPEDFVGVEFSPETKELLSRRGSLSQVDLMRLNRLLLEVAFPGKVTPLPPSDSPPGHVYVQVRPTPLPAVLVLTCAGPAHWHVVPLPGTQIEAVIVNGAGDQTVSGVACPVYSRRVVKDQRPISLPQDYLTSSSQYPYWLTQIAILYQGEVRIHYQAAFSGPIAVPSTDQP